MTSLRYDAIRPEYYLRKWQYYEKARYELADTELEDAKVFFHALKQLCEEDRELLTDVYYRSKEPCTFNVKTGYYHSLHPVKDTVLAKEYGVTKDKLGHLRRCAQMNLKKEMQNVLKKIRHKFVFRLTKRLYLIGFVKEGTFHEQYVLGNEGDAKVFTESEDKHDQMLGLIMLGFEKVPINNTQKVR